MGWMREVTRQPLTSVAASGALQCSYCGEVLCFPVPGLDLDRVARAHYAKAWRHHAAITRHRASL